MSRDTASFGRYFQSRIDAEEAKERKAKQEKQADPEKSTGQEKQMDAKKQPEKLLEPKKQPTTGGEI